MDRKRYMKDVYSKYWMTAREEIYGFSRYDQTLCDYLIGKFPKGEKLLEIAIGTGYPIAAFLQQAAYSVHGIDISLDLIRKCRMTNGSIQCSVGDAEHLPFADSCFGCTYCFHSSWYFPDLTQALDEMLRVTRPSGLVVFDIQNRNCQTIERAYSTRLAECRTRKKIIRHAKNVAKLILRRGTPVWHWVVHDVPTYPESLYQFLQTKPVANLEIFARNKDHSLELKSERGGFADFERLVFAVQKSN